MSQKPSYFRIGLFIVVALAILAGGLIVLGAGQMLGQWSEIATTGMPLRGKI